MLIARCLLAAYMERGRDLEEIKRLTSVNWQDHVTARLAVAVRETTAVPSVRSTVLRRSPPSIFHYEVVVASRNRLSIQSLYYVIYDNPVDIHLIHLSD